MNVSLNDTKTYHLFFLNIEFLNLGLTARGITEQKLNSRAWKWFSQRDRWGRNRVCVSRIVKRDPETKRGCMKQQYGGLEAQSQKIALRAWWLVYLLGLIPHLLSLSSLLPTSGIFSSLHLSCHFGRLPILPRCLSLHHFVTSPSPSRLFSSTFSTVIYSCSAVSATRSSPPPLQPSTSFPSRVLTWRSPPCYLEGKRNANCHQTSKWNLGKMKQCSGRKGHIFWGEKHEGFPKNQWEYF